MSVLDENALVTCIKTEDTETTCVKTEDTEQTPVKAQETWNATADNSFQAVETELEPTDESLPTMSTLSMYSLRPRLLPARPPAPKVRAQTGHITPPTLARRKTPPNQPPSKKKREQLKYATPSVYEHLKPVEDYTANGLDILFCGYNPGIKSSTRGHHFAGPNNSFWKAITQSGLTSEPVTCEDDWRLPRDYNMGVTNLIPRATRASSELSKAEMRGAAPVLLAKIQRLKPRIVCFVGKGVFEMFQGKPCKNWGLQEHRIISEVSDDELKVDPGRKEHATLQFVMPSTSGRTVGIPHSAKVEYFRQLKEIREGMIRGEKYL